jgi:hypothetical protein
MRDRMRGSALLDAAKFTGEIECLYRKMWRSHCTGRISKALVKGSLTAS